MPEMSDLQIGEFGEHLLTRSLSTVGGPPRQPNTIHLTPISVVGRE
jgi:hypothetical protein